MRRRDALLVKDDDETIGTGSSSPRRWNRRAAPLRTGGLLAQRSAHRPPVLIAGGGNEAEDGKSRIAQEPRFRRRRNREACHVLRDCSMNPRSCPRTTKFRLARVSASWRKRASLVANDGPF